MKILKRLLFVLAIPMMVVAVILLFLGGMLLYPIVWMLTGEDEDYWFDMVWAFAGKLFTLCKLDKAL